MLVVLDDDRHVFFWNMHHIICDGWSKSVWAAELSACYGAFSAGAMPALPELPVNYNDYVVRQRLIAPDTLEMQLEYWDQHLAGVETLPGVPTDKPRNATSSPRGEDAIFTLPIQTRRGLENLARRNNATLFMVLHAAWAGLLHRISGQDDVVISVPFGGRPAAEFESLIGFFVNVLAIRLSLRGDPKFIHLIEQTRDSALEGYENHEVPFQRVAERVLSRRDGRAGGFQQVSLAFANLPYQNVHLNGLSAIRYELTRVDIRYELELHMWEDGDDGGLGGRLIYRPDLFELETVTRLVGDLCSVLETVVAAPDTRVSELPVASRSTRPENWLWDLDDTAAETKPIVAPRTATEAAVHAIWTDLIHNEDVSVEDNFLDVGGNSFLLALMVTRIRDYLGAELSVPQIMSDPTIEGIAKLADTASPRDLS